MYCDSFDIDYGSTLCVFLSRGMCSSVHRCVCGGCFVSVLASFVDASASIGPEVWNFRKWAAFCVGNGTWDEFIIILLTSVCSPTIRVSMI